MSPDPAYRPKYPPEWPKGPQPEYVSNSFQMGCTGKLWLLDIDAPKQPKVSRIGCGCQREARPTGYGTFRNTKPYVTLKQTSSKTCAKLAEFLDFSNLLSKKAELTGRTPTPSQTVDSVQGGPGEPRSSEIKNPKDPLLGAPAVDPWESPCPATSSSGAYSAGLVTGRAGRWQW